MAVALPLPKLQSLDDDGKPLVGAKLYVYLAGGTTPTPTYNDANAEFVNTNPIELDSSAFAGILGSMSIWLDQNLSYHMILKDSSDNTVWDVDNITVCAIPEGETGIVPLSDFIFNDRDGNPLAGGLLYIYKAGTTEPAPTYSDSGGTPNDFPVVLDDTGTAPVYVDCALSHKLIVKDSGGRLIWTIDNIQIPRRSFPLRWLITSSLPRPATCHEHSPLRPKGF
jgi:hypothetical protein